MEAGAGAHLCSLIGDLRGSGGSRIGGEHNDGLSPLQAVSGAVFYHLQERSMLAQKVNT